MAALSHAVVAMALGKIYRPQPMPWRFWGLSVLCSLLPDADVIGFALGIDYDDILGHRGLSHSLVFAFCLGNAVVWCCFPGQREVFQSLVVAGAVLYGRDRLTASSTRSPMAAWALPSLPFLRSTRYFFAWRLVKVSRSASPPSLVDGAYASC